MVMNKGLEMVANVERIETNNPGWVSIGYVGGDRCTLITREEWSAFVELIAEVDDVVKSQENKQVE